MDIASNQPIFPLRIISLYDGSSSEVQNIEMLGTDLEVCGEWDTDDPEYAEEVLVLDAHNRPVRVKVKGLVVELCELYSDRPLSEDEIAEIVKASQQKLQQRYEKSFWGRLRRGMRRIIGR